MLACPTGVGMHIDKAIFFLLIAKTISSQIKQSKQLVGCEVFLSFNSIPTGCHLYLFILTLSSFITGKVIEIGKEKLMEAWQNLATHRQFRSNLQLGDIFQIREEIHIRQGHWGRKDKIGTGGYTEYANQFNLRKSKRNIRRSQKTFSIGKHICSNIIEQALKPTAAECSVFINQIPNQ